MHQHFAATLGFDVFEADRRHGFHSVALFDPRDGLLLVLPPHLKAFQLSGGDGDHFGELTFRRILECEIEAFAHSAAFAHNSGEPKMEFGIAAIAFEVIEDHNEAFIGTGIHKGEQCHHALAVHKIAAARHIIGEDGLDLITFGLGTLAAAVFLRIKAGAIFLLFLSRDAAIDQRLGWVVVFNRIVHQ